MWWWDKQWDCGLYHISLSLSLPIIIEPVSWSSSWLRVKEAMYPDTDESSRTG